MSMIRAAFGLLALVVATLVQPLNPVLAAPAPSPRPAPNFRITQLTGSWECSTGVVGPRQPYFEMAIACGTSDAVSCVVVGRLTWPLAGNLNAVQYTEFSGLLTAGAQPSLRLTSLTEFTVMGTGEVNGFTILDGSTSLLNTPITVTNDFRSFTFSMPPISIFQENDLLLVCNRMGSVTAPAAALP